MRLDLYLAETRTLAARQKSVLDVAANKLKTGDRLSELEQNGVLHALQLLIENAIGKAKHILKAHSLPVPVSAYDAFRDLAAMSRSAITDLEQWYSIIGLRNRIVHDYLNLDMQHVLRLVSNNAHMFIYDFLVADIEI
ncbi:hypothetical protein A167_01359 [Alcanivorax sp. S71-1-4]|uniref:type VII toxin-antitoxin system HepT family RNase toxin n=1 Tax=Alcanivorax sp. S71-1-4 TaxID=1177159 RepID=UPI00135B24C8|nr:DUF86 domain-containing protein [Alcanivorax sp. S71-1-4]KAF0809819.1 hypothetical protein A167_01359 [Alcanivorax sp. S71-1-4]